MDAAALTRELKEEAHRQGFHAARATSLGPARHADACRAWLEAGMHGEMGYMARDPERRVNPASVFPGARSALVVSLNYHTPSPTESDPLTGAIARYARRADYHDIMWARLNGLADWVRRRAPGANARGFVDTAPILERDLASAAGLGWIGRNTCLIAPRVGSWFFLGELLLTVPLVPDPPVPEHCGSCARCLAACPTGAFASPYVLDARRCIAYLTIELKGPIPRELRPLVGNRIFGCDVCQEACPHNRWPLVSSDPDIAPRPDIDAPRLPDLLSLDETGFRRVFRGTPVFRTKRRGLLRNVCVALGNSGDPAAIHALRDALADPEPLIRGHAAWALGRLGAASISRSAADGEKDPWVRAEMLRSGEDA